MSKEVQKQKPNKQPAVSREVRKQKHDKRVALESTTKDREELENEMITAALTGDVKAISRLLEQGIDVDTRDPEHNETALMLALGSDHLEAARLLLRHGADIHARTNEGKTPVNYAATSILPELIAAGADLNAQDQDGETTFIRTAQAAGIDHMVWLMEHGADIHITDDNGMNALDHAKRYGFLNIVALLEKAGLKAHDDRA